MSRVLTIALIFGIGGCVPSKEPRLTSDNPRLAVAERLIDAFYSFDPEALRSALSDAPASEPQLMYYQGWAEGGHYVVLTRRPCRIDTAHEVSCDITVKDDLITALKIGYDVTDTFHLTFSDGKIVNVRNSSNDPPQMDAAFKWLRRERPDIWSGPCRDFYAGGITPQDCVRAVVQGFAEFTARRTM